MNKMVIKNYKKLINNKFQLVLLASKKSRILKRKYNNISNNEYILLGLINTIIDIKKKQLNSYKK